MKKKYLVLVMATVLTAVIAGCGKTGNVTGSAETSDASLSGNEDDGGTQNNAAIANPWADSTEEEAYQYAPNGFSAPEGATNVAWSICIEPDDKVLPGTMVQMTFDYEGLSFTARQQPVPGEEITDISGLYYEWTAEDDGTLSNWGGGQMPCRFYRYIGEDESIDLCLWFDIETGYAYSLSTEAPDLDGFDIQAVAEAMYDPAKQIGANAPDGGNVNPDTGE